jgi:hypothetical protein
MASALKRCHWWRPQATFPNTGMAGRGERLKDTEVPIGFGDPCSSRLSLKDSKRLAQDP